MDMGTGMGMGMAAALRRIRLLSDIRFINLLGRRSANLNLTGSVSVVGLLLSGATTPVLAQYPEPPVEAPAPRQQSDEMPVTPSIEPAAAADSVAAIAPRREWSILPRLSVAEIVTDNVAPGSGDRRSDSVTEVSPGINITHEGARAKLYLDYQLRKFLYAKESGQGKPQNFLNAYGTVETIEDWMFIDVSGVVTQQDISPFGVQTASSASINGNRTEASNFKVSPYFRGRFLGAADYELRYVRSAANTNSTSASDLDTTEWIGKIGGATPLASLGWSVDASRQSFDYSRGRKSEADHARALVSYNFSPQFKVSLGAGREANDYLSLTKETYTTRGYGFDWSPTERTQVSAFRERRFFGNGHSFSFNHRTRLSAWKYTDSRDVSILPNQLATVGLGTYYDLMFSQLASSMPDTVERAAFVNSQLQTLGIQPNAQVTSGFLTSHVSIERRQELSFILQGVRNVLTLAATRSEHERPDGTNGFSNFFGNFRNIRQRGFNINLSHRLSPLSTLALTAARQDSTGSRETADLETRQRSLTVNFSTRLSQKVTASLGARRTIFDSTVPTQPYSENALVGSLTVLF